MNPTAMVSVDTAAATARPRSAGVQGERAATPDDQGFAGVMCAAARPASGDEAAAVDAQDDSDASEPTDATASADTAERAPADAAQGESCTAQVLALLGLSSPTADPKPAAAATPQAEPHAQRPGTGRPLLADRASLRAEALEGAPPIHESRGELRAGSPGAAGSVIDTAPAMLLPGIQAGSDPRTTDAAPPQASVDPATGTPGEAQRTRAASPNSTAPSTPPGTSLQQPVGTPAWRDELGVRLAMMVDQGEQLATLHLTPDELGPVEVRLALREGEATVWFTAQAGDTRAALEQALPRLREMFASGGLALAHAAVNADTSREPPRPAALAGLGRNRREADERGPEAITTAAPLRRGLLDLYA